jgi:hypothetical protein
MFLSHLSPFADSDTDDGTEVGARRTATRARGRRVRARGARGRRTFRSRGTTGRAGCRTRAAGDGGEGAYAFEPNQVDVDDGWAPAARIDRSSFDVREVDMVFQVRTPGPVNIPPNATNPIDFFMLFLTKEIMVHMVRETNR